MPYTIKEKVDVIVEKTNLINSLLLEIGKITDGQHSLHIAEFGKKRKKHHLTVSVDISKL
jgi:hypothetical protein